MRALLILLLALPSFAQQSFQFTTRSAQFPSSIGIVGVIVADFNGDGNPDFALVNRLTYSIFIMLGDGSGDYVEAPGSRFHAGNGPNVSIAADFNGDGKIDLAVLSSFTEPLTPFRSSFAIFFGDGLGGFTPGPVQITSAVASSMVSADFDRDGLADLAIGGTDGTSILLNDGAANFRLLGTPFGNSVSTLVAGVIFTSGFVSSVALTDVSGIATSSLLLNNTPGDYIVTATVSGYTGLSVVYQLRN